MKAPNLPPYLMIMSFAVGQAFLLIMPRAKKWLLTLCTDKVFDVPLLPECVDDAVFNWAPTCAANRNAHLKNSG